MRNWKNDEIPHYFYEAETKDDRGRKLNGTDFLSGIGVEKCVGNGGGGREKIKHCEMTSIVRHLGRSCQLPRCDLTRRRIAVDVSGHRARVESANSKRMISRLRSPRFSTKAEDATAKKGSD
jgi:hypothetical protein